MCERTLLMHIENGGAYSDFTMQTPQLHWAMQLAYNFVMSHILAYEPGGIAYMQFAGFFSAADVLKATRKIHNDPGFHTLQGLINDFTAVTDIPDKVDASDLDDLMAETIGASLHKSKLRVAVVTTSQLIADMSLIYLEATEGAWSVKVFPTLDTARVWLATPDSSGFRMPTRR